MTTRNVILDVPRPVEVLHDGRWLPGWLKAYRRDDNGGWRGLVDYRATRSPSGTGCSGAVSASFGGTS